ncbi:hypothetical protein HKCCE2091_09940 [Rhodobacterales bacterium HKCCE2091]|nr:hypothetical protein [Rhodobacterales bacterium HKCCE2091]
MRQAGIAAAAMALASVPTAWPAFAGTTRICDFPTLPQAVLDYPDTGAASMSVGNRPAAVMEVLSPVDGPDSAVIDGYEFSFVLHSSTMTVRLDGEVVAQERGTCVTRTAQVNDMPLMLGQAPEAPAGDTGAWEIATSVSPFDDSTTVVLRLESEDEVEDRFGFPLRPVLMLRCQENTTSFYIMAAGHFLSDTGGRGRVDYRIDSRPRGVWSLRAANSNQALGLWTGDQAIPVIRDLMGGDRLAVRLTPYNASALQFDFPISGLDAAIAPLREACGW